MAKTPPAAADAPVLDQEVEGLAGGEGAPGNKLKAAMQALLARLPRPKLGLPKIAMSKKLMIIVGASVLTVSGAGAAALAFWPAEPEPVKKPPLVAKKSKKAKKSASAASAASAASPAEAASTAEAAASAGAAASEPALAHAPAASGPEEPMDRLQRRLSETLAGGGKLEAGGPGELKVTARVGEPRATPAPRGVTRGGDEPGVLPRAEKRSLHAKAELSDEHEPAITAKQSAAALQHLHWSYDGAAGPDAWGRLKPEFAKCSTGTRQSPIDIRDGIQVSLDPIRFDYKPSGFRVIDNGHTVQVNVDAGNVIEVNGKRFELLQFHFHRPSEERIDGRQFDMVAHLVHKDAEGKLAVVAVLLDRGSVHPLVQQVWNNLPLEKGEEQAAQSTMDLNQLLPSERSYYTYMGSLTTPPCSEGVLWMVMKKPVNIAPEQIGIFARLYPMNARPVQSASGRMIKESN
jgi:carbonic anhydrase